MPWLTSAANNNPVGIIIEGKGSEVKPILTTSTTLSSSYITHHIRTRSIPIPQHGLLWFPSSRSTPRMPFKYTASIISNKLKWLGIYLVLTALLFSRFSCSEVTSRDLGLERVWIRPEMSHGEHQSALSAPERRLTNRAGDDSYYQRIQRSLLPPLQGHLLHLPRPPPIR